MNGRENFFSKTFKNVFSKRRPVKKTFVKDLLIKNCERQRKYFFKDFLIRNGLPSGKYFSKTCWAKISYFEEIFLPSSLPKSGNYRRKIHLLLKKLFQGPSDQKIWTIENKIVNYWRNIFQGTAERTFKKYFYWILSRIVTFRRNNFQRPLDWNYLLLKKKF